MSVRIGSTDDADPNYPWILHLFLTFSSTNQQEQSQPKCLFASTQPTNSISVNSTFSVGETVSTLTWPATMIGKADRRRLDSLL